MSLFFANFGYRLRFGIEPPSPNEECDPKLRRADRIAARIRNKDQRLSTTIRSMQEKYAHHTNKHRLPHPNYQISDVVYLDARSFGASIPNRGLN